jgi:hypothetical protein
MQEQEIEDEFEEFSLKDDFAQSSFPKFKFVKKVVKSFFFKTRNNVTKTRHTQLKVPTYNSYGTT